jgi:8-amino-7-oxononanoate synthase
MPDFTSVLYLGMHHGHESLPSWRRLTTGRPAALGSTGRAQRLTERLARLTGNHTAALGVSTLHLFWDLFQSLARGGGAIHLDAGAYPIARWGVERAAAQGVRVTLFRQHDADALHQNLLRGGRPRPIIVADGLCPLTGRPAPLNDYARIGREFGGLLIVDDTQGLGILGDRPSDIAPYGRGGGGTPSWCAVRDTNLIVVGSLAKAFGAPLAMIAGAKAWIDRFEADSLTRVHCSPPSMAAISAGEHALALNAAEGEARRSRLLFLVKLFSQGLERIGMAAHGGMFPLQTLKYLTGVEAIELHARLLLTGVRTVLHRGADNGRALVSFVFNCLHTDDDIANALHALNLCRLTRSGMRLAYSRARKSGLLSPG